MAGLYDVGRKVVDTDSNDFTSVAETGGDTMIQNEREATTVGVAITVDDVRKRWLEMKKYGCAARVCQSLRK